MAWLGVLRPSLFAAPRRSDLTVAKRRVRALTMENFAGAAAPDSKTTSALPRPDIQAIAGFSSVALPSTELAGPPCDHAQLAPREK